MKMVLAADAVEPSKDDGVISHAGITLPECWQCCQGLGEI
jgi:hypothetical protein